MADSIENKLRGLILSASELQQFGILPEALVEDYLTIGENILTLAKGADSSNEQIEQNTQDIATNASDVNQNSIDINDNRFDINTNTSNIATNTSNIATNTSNIATNTSNINTLLNKAYSSFYLTTPGATGIGATATTMVLNNTRLNSGDFALSASEVTVNKSGDYSVLADVSINSSEGFQSAAELWLEVDAVEVPGTRAPIYIEGNSEGNSGSISTDLTLSDTEVVRIRLSVVTGSAINVFQVDNGTRLNFKEI